MEPLMKKWKYAERTKLEYYIANINHEEKSKNGERGREEEENNKGEEGKRKKRICFC